MSADLTLPADLLNGRKVLVTGAARGLGFAFAEQIARAGARVVLADILAEQVQQSAAQLRELGLDVHAVTIDVRELQSVQAAVTAAVAWLGGLDGLVNNAAITNSGGKTTEELDIDTWDRVMEVNVRGCWLVTNACLPALRASQRAAIVNLASDTALWGAPKLLAYTASKGAVMAMTRTLATELGDDGITVNAIAPGLVAVEATEYVPEDRKQLYRQQRPLKRTQLPEDVCGAVIFALSDLSRFITGQTLPVNGGFVMP
ncbi:SDR family oxidoreductase [Oceanobacter mangrovi]|uniref:SDR family oxidoreductase n=1 Tax=Oceanobacter mangrovi TaxID=2862510 RepID=UPI001C8E0E3B|nr:SDR family oxidoreductase [Oceanobacter mangrovi]